MFLSEWREFPYKFIPHLTGVLINSEPDQEGNKLMFMSEWREFSSAPCLAGKKKT